VDQLEGKFAKGLDRLETKQRKLERDLVADEAEFEARKREEIVGVGETVLSFFMGRRRTSAATTIARRRRMTSKVKMDIEDTKEEIAELKEDAAEMERELKEAVNEITDRWEKAPNELVAEELKPRRMDVNVHLVALAWAPFLMFTYTEGNLYGTITRPAYSR
jgi:DNA anti-recombination protein RmuC